MNLSFPVQSKYVHLRPRHILTRAPDELFMKIQILQFEFGYTVYIFEILGGR